MQKFIPFLAIVALVPLGLVGLHALANSNELSTVEHEMRTYGPDKYGVACYKHVSSGGWACVKVKEEAK